MLPAKVALNDSSNGKLFTSKPSASSRFQEVFELLPQQSQGLELPIGEIPSLIIIVIVMSDGGDSDTEGVVDPVTLISKLDVSNPLHLHSNDSAVLTVVSVKLKGTENYQVWANAMLLSLEGKNKIGFIDGQPIK
ncbi:ribonuclease H-like domain-containing protein [Tanacetum coccineum]